MKTLLIVLASTVELHMPAASSSPAELMTRDRRCTAEACPAARKPTIETSFPSISQQAEVARITYTKVDLRTSDKAIGLVETDGPVQKEYRTNNSRETIVREETTLGNGVMVSPCYMLTNHHVVYGDDFAASGVRRAIFHLSNGDVEKGESKTNLRGNRSRHQDQDWAIVYIPSCPGNKVGWVELDTRPVEQLMGSRVILAGIPAASASTKVVKYNCKISRVKENGSLEHDCSPPSGFSGAPIFHSTTGKLVAIHAGDGEAVATADIFVKRIAFRIEADKKASSAH